MNLHRRNVLLLLLLGGLVAASVALERPGTETTVASLFPGFDAARAARIEISVPGEGGMATLTIARHEDEWVLSGQRNFPVLASAVDDLLARVTNLATIDRAGSEATSHALFGVDDTGRRLRIEDAAGTVLAELRQGEGPADGAGSYVRPLPGDAVYRTTDLALLETNTGRWIDTRLVSFDAAAVKGLFARLAGDDGEELKFDLLRLDDGRWRAVDVDPSVETEYLAPAVVEPLLRVLPSLFFREIADAHVATPEAGFSPPRILVELDVGEEQLTSVWIGALAPGDDVRYATDPHWPTDWLVTLPAASAARLEAVIRRVDRARR